MKALCVLIAVLFGAKILWNLIIAYVLAWEFVQADSKETRHISLMPGIEIGLFVFMLCLSWFIGGNFVLDPESVLRNGLIAIVLSYLHLVLIGFVGGWLATRRRSP